MIISSTYCRSFTYLVRKSFNKLILSVNKKWNLNITPLDVILLILRRKENAQQSAFVKMQWHAYLWHKTLLCRDRDVERAFHFIRTYLIKPNSWKPGDLMDVLSVLETRSSRLRDQKIGLAGILSRMGLSGILSRVRDLMNLNYGKSLELMLITSHLLGVIAFWEMAPQIILEVDPTLILHPDKIQIIWKVIQHHGVQPLDVLDTSIFTENHLHNRIIEDFQQSSLVVTEEARAKARVNALAIAMSSALIVIMLINNSVTTSNITG